MASPCERLSARASFYERSDNIPTPLSIQMDDLYKSARLLLHVPPAFHPTYSWIERRQLRYAGLSLAMRNRLNMCTQVL